VRAGLCRRQLRHDRTASPRKRPVAAARVGEMTISQTIRPPTSPIANTRRQESSVRPIPATASTAPRIGIATAASPSSPGAPRRRARSGEGPSPHGSWGCRRSSCAGWRTGSSYRRPSRRCSRRGAAVQGTTAHR